MTRRRCRTRRSRTGSRCRRNAGESRLPRSSPMLCACRQHAESQHWSHRSRPGGAGAIACASCMIGRAQDARKRAHERRWGEVWRVGMGWAAHRKSLIFECPVSFSELTNPCQLQRPGSPISLRKSLTASCRNALNWSIIDMAREHPNARISRQQGGHCRWQVAAGGDRMWPTCAMRWCWARFGGAHRESSPSIPPLQLPAWSRSRAVVKTLDAF